MLTPFVPFRMRQKEGGRGGGEGEDTEWRQGGGGRLQETEERRGPREPCAGFVANVGIVARDRHVILDFNGLVSFVLAPLTTRAVMSCACFSAYVCTHATSHIHTLEG